MITNSDLDNDERAWVASLSGSRLANFFNKCRQASLRQLNSPSVDAVKGLQVQHEVAALFRLEQAFIAMQKARENK